MIETLYCLSLLSGKYPIPLIDKIVGSTENYDEVEDYAFEWIHKGCVVDCSFFKKDNGYAVSIYTSGQHYLFYPFAVGDKSYMNKLKELLEELYAG